MARKSVCENTGTQKERITAENQRLNRRAFLKTTGVASLIAVATGTAAARGGSTGETEQPSHEEADLYVAPDGDDDGAGTVDDPYASLKKVASVLDTTTDSSELLVYCRGGEYAENGDRIDLRPEGNAGAPVRVENYPGEEPVFNLDSVEASQYEGALRIEDAAHLELRGITFEGGPYHTCEISGDIQNLTLEYCNFYAADGHSGVQISLASSARRIDFFGCESAYHHGSDSADGFRIDPDSAGGAVTFTRCAAHHNRDDGWDLWGGNDELLEYCVAYRNGYEDETASSPVFEDGNAGFKLSGGAGHNGNTLIKCVAFDNALYGVACNDNENPHTIHNVTAIGNDVNYWVGHSSDQMRNCLSYDGTNADIGVDSVDARACTWTENIDDTEFITEDRDADAFLVLESSSQCINAGTTDGVETDSYTYGGEAPDIGALDRSLAEQLWEDIGLDPNETESGPY